MLPQDNIDTHKLMMYLDTFRDNIRLDIFDIVFPVGSIYTSTTDTRSPELIIGIGTWVAIKGRVLVGIDSTQTEFDAMAETGGAKTHTLTEAQIPAHNHPVRTTDNNYTIGVSTVYAGGSAQEAMRRTATADMLRTTNVGGGTAHNNLQPYIVVAMWERTA